LSCSFSGSPFPGRIPLVQIDRGKSCLPCIRWIVSPQRQSCLFFLSEDWKTISFLPPARIRRSSLFLFLIWAPRSQERFGFSSEAGFLLKCLAFNPPRKEVCVFSLCLIALRISAGFPPRRALPSELSNSFRVFICMIVVSLLSRLFLFLRSRLPASRSRAMLSLIIGYEDLFDHFIRFPNRRKGQPAFPVRFSLVMHISQISSSLWMKRSFFSPYSLQLSILR